MVFAAIVGAPLAVGYLNVEKWAENKGYDRFLIENEGAIMDLLIAIWRSLSSDIAIGIAIGGLLIAFAPSLWRFIRILAGRPKIEGMREDALTAPPKLVEANEEGAETQPDTEYYKDEGPYEGSHHDLMIFVIDHVMHTCSAQIEIQKKIIESIANNDEIKKYVCLGIRQDYPVKDLSDALDILHGLWASPAEHIELNPMIDCVDKVERGYSDLVQQTLSLAQSVNIDIESDCNLRPLWDEWQARHDKLVEAYEPIKRDSNLGKLFRPGRHSRWRDAPRLMKKENTE